MSSWQMFFFGGGKCPNLGVVNVRILGGVNVLLANDSQSLEQPPLGPLRHHPSPPTESGRRQVTAVARMDAPTFSILNVDGPSSPPPQPPTTTTSPPPSPRPPSRRPPFCYMYCRREDHCEVCGRCEEPCNHHRGCHCARDDDYEDDDCQICNILISNAYRREYCGHALMLL